MPWITRRLNDQASVKPRNGIIFTEGIYAQPRFFHDDVVKLRGQEQVGTVKDVQEIDDDYVKVQAGETGAGIVTVFESDLELVGIANNEETGFALRYIT